MEKREIYDEVCKTLTRFEHPEESGLDEKYFNEQILNEMYRTLVCVQNFFSDEYGF